VILLKNRHSRREADWVRIAAKNSAKWNSCYGQQGCIPDIKIVIMVKICNPFYDLSVDG
jgi:hypothetical protein